MAHYPLREDKKTHSAKAAAASSSDKESESTLDAACSHLWGAHSLAHWKVSLFGAALDVCDRNEARVQILTQRLQESSLARRILLQEQELLDVGPSDLWDSSGNDSIASMVSRRLDQIDERFAAADATATVATMSEQQKESQDERWPLLVQLMAQYPNVLEVQLECLRRIRRCLEHEQHKKAVVRAGGLAALVACLSRVVLVTAPIAAQISTPYCRAEVVRDAVTLVIRLLYAPGSAEYYTKQGVPVGSSKDGQVLHLPLVELLDEAQAWKVLYAAAQSDAWHAACGGEGKSNSNDHRHSEEGAYERALALQSIASVAQHLRDELHTPAQLARRIGFLRTCLASALNDSTIGEPLGSILKQH